MQSTRPCLQCGNLSVAPRLPAGIRCLKPSMHSVQQQRQLRQQPSLRAQKTEEQQSAEETTEKWGLEAGLWKVFTKKDKEAGGKTKGQQAKDLLARYGSAYLITSISFALVSFTLCYLLVNNGVDVSALLQRVGLKPSDTGDKVGTVAIAYAAHKALSPVRFPPTVALTPVVARLIGKEPKAEDKAQDL